MNNEDKILKKNQKISKTQKILEKKEFSIVHWNCNGICKKIDEVVLFINKVKPDIISLN